MSSTNAYMRKYMQEYRQGKRRGRKGSNWKRNLRLDQCKGCGIEIGYSKATLCVKCIKEGVKEDNVRSLS